MSARQFAGALGAMAALVLMVMALWAWGRAGWMSADATRPDVARWAIRSGAVSVAAIAQFVLLTFVAAPVFRSPRRLTADLMRLTVGTVAGVAMVSAVALGLAGR
jgi:hypothetical protein